MRQVEVTSTARNVELSNGTLRVLLANACVFLKKNGGLRRTQTLSKREWKDELGEECNGSLRIARQ